jgi:hypothetical protein
MTSPGRLLLPLVILAQIFWVERGAIASDAIQVTSTKPVEGAKVALEHKEITAPAGPISVWFVTLDPGSSRLRLAVPRNPMGGGSSLWDFFRDERALAAFTGGYLSTYAPASPAGLVKHNNAVVNEIDSSDKVMTAVLCLVPPAGAGGILVTSVGDHQTFNQWDGCIQAGPTLIAQGRVADDLELLEKQIANRPTERKSSLAAGAYERAFVIKTRSGRVVLGLSSPASLYDIRALAGLDASNSGFDAETAVILTGWRTAGLVVAGASPLGSPSTLLPNAIVVLPPD